MDAFSVLVASGFVGGLVCAAVLLVVHRMSRRAGSPVVVANVLLPAPIINMASIKVEGVGGLGMVIVCIGVAVAIPSIGRSMTVAGILGVVFAVVLIARRRRGPLPSNGAGPGAHTMLSIDTPARDGVPPGQPPSDLRRLALGL